MDPEAEARRRKAVVGLGGKFAWQEGVSEALDKVGERSDDGWIVCLVSRTWRTWYPALALLTGQEIPASDPGAVTLLKSESCPPSQLASKLPAKSPCYTFYSFPTPAPSTPVVAKSDTPASARNTFQASEGGARAVTSTWQPKSEPEKLDASEPSESAGEVKKEDENGDKPESEETPEVKSLSLSDTQTPTPAAGVKSKGRVLFIYTCPSGSPIKFRMVYSSGVRSIQQDAKDKAGVEIAAKVGPNLCSPHSCCS
jgi:hypothetical protein